MKRIAPIGAVIALGACSGRQSVLDPAGDQAQSLATLFSLSFWVCGIAYLLVLALPAAGLWRARGRFSTSENPVIEPADRTMGRALILWTGVIVVALTVLIVASFLADRALSASRTRTAMQIRVTGHQWWWRLHYRDPATRKWIETANELHLPVGRTARIVLGSSDVIHSFWVPNVAGKMDVIPGRINVIDITPRRTGWFRGQCAEFCGSQHAHMAFDVKVESQAAFDAWIAGQARPASTPRNASSARGLRVFNAQCAICHAVRGTDAVGRPGPDLTHIGSRRSIAAGTLPFSRGALQGWIAQPQALKPGTMMPAVALVPADADAVAGYLESLK